MDVGLIQSIWTVVALVVFLGVCVWAWSARRKADFDEAARLPFTDDEPQTKRD